jgi:hypothetical protein
MILKNNVYNSNIMNADKICLKIDDVKDGIIIKF